MPEIKLIALRPIVYGGRNYRPGEAFEAADVDALRLVRFGEAIKQLERQNERLATS